MLIAERLLELASGKQGEKRPDRSDRNCENDNSGQQNPGETRANPTDRSDPNENSTMQQIPDFGGLSPDSEELLHPRDCPQWWKGCFACPWYHPGGGDFCWKVNRAWWEEPYPGGEP